MKTFRFILYLLVLAVCLTGVSSCGPDNPDAELSQRQLYLNILKNKTYKIKTVTIDGVDRTNLFTGLTLTFNGELNRDNTVAKPLTYTTTNGNAVWPASGGFEFITDLQLKRSDDVIIDVKSFFVTALNLELTWNATSYGGGRELGVKGKHLFMFE